MSVFNRLFCMDWSTTLARIWSKCLFKLLIICWQHFFLTLIFVFLSSTCSCNSSLPIFFPLGVRLQRPVLIRQSCSNCMARDFFDLQSTDYIFIYALKSFALYSGLGSLDNCDVRPHQYLIAGYPLSNTICFWSWFSISCALWVC